MPLRVPIQLRTCTTGVLGIFKCTKLSYVPKSAPCAARKWRGPTVAVGTPPVWSGDPFADAAWLALAIAVGIAVVAALARLPPRRQADVGDRLTNFAQSSGQARRYSPFYFSYPASRLPDYQLTYSQFRILKCKLQLSLASEGGDVDNYLVAPSRPFARNMGPSSLGDNQTEKFVLLPKRRLYARLDGRRSSIPTR